MDPATIMRRGAPAAPRYTREDTVTHLTVLPARATLLLAQAMGAGYDYVGLRTNPLHLSG